MLILGILCLFLFCFCLLIQVTTGIPAPEDPDMWPVDRDKLAKPALELPDFARTKDKDQSLRTELVALLETRGELERAFMLGGLLRYSTLPECLFSGRTTILDDVGEAGERWRSLARRENNACAAALAAALRRLCPKKFPAGEADSRQEALLTLPDEGERQFLLGLSCLRLYEPFLFQARNTALTAWRLAVWHFRRSAAAGHAEGMKAAFLLARIGHDVPFTPPAELPESLSADDPSLETTYWCYRLAEAGDGFAAFTLGTHYLQHDTPDMARAEHWLRRAMETGEQQTVHTLVELPDFARTDDEDQSLRAGLADLLRKRGELELAFMLGGLLRRATSFEALFTDRTTSLGDVKEAGKRWCALACRRKNLYAAALAAALCRLRPKDFPADEAAFRQEDFLDLLDEGEGHFLLGLSYLRLYDPFLLQSRNTALTAWRQAVAHFRRSAAAGHEDGMEAALLLARIGHDVPFTPPNELPEALSAETSYPESIYWCYRLAETGDGFAAFLLGTHYFQRATLDMARAEYWLRRAMETGEYRAAHTLYENYRNGSFPDGTGKKAAICLIFLSHHTEKAEEAARMASDDRMRRLLAACEEEGTALYDSAMEKRRSRLDTARERSLHCLAQAAKKLPALCGAADAGRERQRQAGTRGTAPALRAETLRGRPETRRPTRDDKPCRSFARPDKR